MSGADERSPSAASKFVWAADDSLWSSNVPELLAHIPEKWIVTHIERPKPKVVHA